MKGLKVILATSSLDLLVCWSKPLACEPWLVRAGLTSIALGID